MSSEQQKAAWKARVNAALADGDSISVQALLEDAHATDVAEVFLELDDEEQQALLEMLDDEQTAELLVELDTEDRAELLDQLPAERASDVLEEMFSDDAADVLSELPSQEANDLLERMEPEMADDVAALLRYPDGTAGRLMATEFVRLRPDDTVNAVLSAMHQHADDAEMIYYLYVLDDDDRLLGSVNLRQLIICDPAQTMAEIMNREYVSVATDTPQERVAEVVRRHDLLAVPVLDEEGRMHGIVTVDDVGEVVEEEGADALLEVSGTADSESTVRPVAQWRGWRSGVLALGGGLLASALVWVLARHVTHLTQVIVLLPLLLVLGITGSSQVALAMDNAYESPVERNYVPLIFLRELLAGAALACIGALLAGGLILVLNRHLSITAAIVPAIAVAVPMFLGLWIGAIAGAIGASIVRRRGGYLSSSPHTIIVVIALLLAITTYFICACWLASVLLP